MHLGATMTFSRRLLAWYDRAGRKNMPWQHPRPPYRVWLSEIMLQQTQVATVIPYFKRFIKAYPTLKKLANAPLDDVLALWAGLGYYARARNLHKTAQCLMSDFHGKFPDDLDTLQSLPGIGRSTAGAILAMGFEKRATILDGNVKRVLTRYHAIEGWPDDRVIQKELWAIAEKLTPHKHIAAYTQAIMDLGATLCTRTQPQCTACPFKRSCQAHALDLTFRKTPQAPPDPFSRPFF